MRIACNWSTAEGRLFNGDEILYLMVKERLSRGGATASKRVNEHVPGVVGTLMTNMAVELALRAQGVELVRAKVGDRYVLEELEKRGWLLGGEGSGHLLALDKHTTGDGIGVRIAGVAGLRAQWPNAGAIAVRRDPVPANVDQCSSSARSKLAGQRPFGG